MIWNLIGALNKDCRETRRDTRAVSWQSNMPFCPVLLGRDSYSVKKVPRTGLIALLCNYITFIDLDL